MENRIKAFIDTNILLDYMIPSREGHDVVVNLFSLILTAKIEAAFSTQSILDAVYIGRKLPDFPEAFRETLGALLLDVREEEDYHAGHIPGSTFISLQAIPTPVLQTVPDKGTPLFVYCYRGNRSRYAVSILKEAGYTNVTNIGGIEFYHGDLEKS